MKARCCDFILTTMDLAQIGAHCSLPSCNVLDFLPIVCQCKAYFCSQHISPDLHACRSVHANITNTSTTSALPLQRCTLDECQKPSLPVYNETGCSSCLKSFCAKCVSRTGTPFLSIHFCLAIDTQKRTIAHRNSWLPPLQRVHLLRVSKNRCESAALIHQLTPINCFSGRKWMR
jgi:hypothetical protein